MAPALLRRSTAAEVAFASFASGACQSSLVKQMNRGRRDEDGEDREKENE
jgi:hypothetical protein